MRNISMGSCVAVMFGVLATAMPVTAGAHAPAGIVAGDVTGSVRREVISKQVCDCRPVRKVKTVRKVRRVYRTDTYAFYPRPVWGPVHYYVEPPVRQPLFPYEPFLPTRYW